MVTGKVSTQARAMLRMVLAWRFLTPLLATMAPAIPDDSTWVVLTGKPDADATPIIVAATSSAEAPCA